MRIVKVREIKVKRWGRGCPSCGSKNIRTEDRTYQNDQFEEVACICNDCGYEW